jgi:hypothetical protein
MEKTEDNYLCLKCNKQEYDDMEKRRPTERFVIKMRDGSGESTEVITKWPGNYGGSWTFNNRLTEEKLIEVFRAFKDKKTWNNVYANDNKDALGFAKKTTKKTDEAW